MDYRIFLIKQASKLDAMLRAGKLSDKSWGKIIENYGIAFPRNKYDDLKKAIQQGSLTNKNLYSDLRADLVNLRLGMRTHDSRTLPAPTIETGYLPNGLWRDLIHDNRKWDPKFPGYADLVKRRPAWNKDPLINSNPSPNVWHDSKSFVSWHALDPKINENEIMAKAPNLDFRHEIGHWAQSKMRVFEPEKYRNMLAVRLARMYKTKPKFFKQVLALSRDQSLKILQEIGGHYLAAKAGRRGAQLREATKRNWSSKWADKIRRKYGDEATASVVEHLQRNYGVKGGKLLS